WNASRAQGRGPHQQALPPVTYLLAPWVSVGQGSLVTEDPREVCPLSGGVISPGGSTPIRSITGRRSRSPSSFTRRLMGSSRESLSLAGRRRAYHVPPMCLGGEGRSSSPVVRHLRRGNCEPPNLTTCLLAQA